MLQVCVLALLVALVTPVSAQFSPFGRDANTTAGQARTGTDNNAAPSLRQFTLPSDRRTRAASAAPVTISGLVKWGGELPSDAKLEVNQDGAWCGNENAERAFDRAADVNAENLAIANAVVWLEPMSRLVRELPTTNTEVLRPPVIQSLDFFDCGIAPAASVVARRTRFHALNRDEIEHRLTIVGPAGWRREAELGAKGAADDFRLGEPGMYHVRCLKHPWETAGIVVAENVFAMVTGKGGQFMFPQVPRGRYRLRAWHEGLHPTPRLEMGRVTDYDFGDGAGGELSLTLPADARRSLVISLREAGAELPTEAEEADGRVSPQNGTGGNFGSRQTGSNRRDTRR